MTLRSGRRAPIAFTLRSGKSHCSPQTDSVAASYSPALSECKRSLLFGFAILTPLFGPVSPQEAENRQPCFSRYSDGVLIRHDSSVDLFQYANPARISELRESFKQDFESGNYRLKRHPCEICGEQGNWLGVAVSEAVGGGNNPQRFKWEICGSCGLLQIRTRFDTQSTDLFYSSGDYHSLCMGDLSKEEHWELYSTCAAPDLALNLELMGIDVSTKSILDVGCGPGAVLLHLKSLGAVVEGFDADPYVIEYGRQFIEEIRVGNANSEQISQEVDIVFLGCVLPHLSNPLSFVRTLRESMNTEQRLILTLPNLDYCFEYSDESFSKFLHIGHYFYFNVTTIERLLNLGGFSIESVVPRGAAMAIEAKKSSKPLLNENNAFWTSVSAINLMNIKTSRVAFDLEEIARNWGQVSFSRRVWRKLSSTVSKIFYRIKLSHLLEVSRGPIRRK